MTIFIVSLFLPYTINFHAHRPKDGLHRPSSSYAAVDGPGSIVGRLSDSPYKTHRRSVPPTPGATTEEETVFTGYTLRVTDEVPIRNEYPSFFGPSEPREFPWGCSRTSNQPRSEATSTPTPSILRSPGLQKAPRKNMSLDGSQDLMGAEGPSSPRVLLSTVDWSVKAAEQGHGGLRNAIFAAERFELLENRMWVGTLGMPTDSVTDPTRGDIANTLRKRFRSLTVFVSDTEFEGHYTHFCRTVLRPVLHYQMQESPRHSEYEGYSWAQYFKLNEIFADTIVEHWKPGDKIWVHDYHLLVLPGLLRERLPQAEIGFFLHTPFPSSEIFRCLTSREQMLDGLLGADLIGFQTDEYQNHFLHTCSRLRGLDISIDQINFNGRFIGVVNTPIGIDRQLLNRTRDCIEVEGWMKSINLKYQGKKRLIVARDRLDAPGGIKQKLLAYELFLKNYPAWREHVVLIQVISSPSDTPELEAQVSKIAMRINTTYSTVTHQPLVLLQQDINQFQFIALLSVAHIFMATNLREGMNLNSHDFIRCQDGRYGGHRYGSLILSEFVGSATIFHERSGSSFKEHKLLVNPWNYKQCADAINATLEMSPADQEAEWERLSLLEYRYSSRKWYTRLKRALNKARDIQQLRQINDTSPLSLEDLESLYLTTRGRIFFLEDVSTFGPGFPTEESAISKKAIETLQVLLRDPQNILYITSNHRIDQIKETLPQLPSNVGFLFENGCCVKKENWVQFVTKPPWLPGIQTMMEYFQKRTEGSRIEETPWSLIFHYDDALDNQVAAHHASELADQVNGARGSADFHIVRDATSISVERPLSYQGKARAARFALKNLPNAEKPEFIFVASGSRNDEALFRWANELAANDARARFRTTPFGQRLKVTTLTTGTHATEAKSTLPVGVSILDVLESLSRLTSLMDDESTESSSPESVW